MSLLVESRCGSRIPTLGLRLPPAAADTGLADDVIEWAKAVGFELFDWQNDVLRQLLTLGVDGKWSAYEATIITPRQNGKNEILAVLEYASVGLLGNREIVHSAHELATAQKHLEHMRDLAKALPELRKLLPTTRKLGFHDSNGKEAIHFRNGAVIDFRARTKDGVRGFSADRVILDEAFSLPPRAVGSMMYTLRARPNAQVIKTSSPAHHDSVVLHVDRQRCDGNDPADSRFLYMAWGNEADVDPGDPEGWARSNPSLGLQAPGFELDEQTFRNEFASARHNEELLAEFIREVCGVPEEPDGLEKVDDCPIDLKAWAELGDPNSLAEERTIRICLDAPPDRRCAWFGSAGLRPDGLLHGQMRHQCRRSSENDRSLKSQVVAAAKTLTKRHHTSLIIPPGSPAEAWERDLEAAGVKIDKMTRPEYLAACGRIGDAIDSREFRHRNQEELNVAVAGLAARASGDNEAWSRRSSSSDIGPFVAVTCAAARVAVPSKSRSAYEDDGLTTV